MPTRGRIARVSSLNEQRDAFVVNLRALVDRFNQLHPGGSDFRGITSRAADVLAAQGPAIEDLSALDLEQADPDVAFETLMRAQHLPRMIAAFVRVLESEEKTTSLRPLLTDLINVSHQLDQLTQAWLRQGSTLEFDLPEEDQIV